MISTFVVNIADQMCVKISEMSIVDGREAGCIGVMLLHLTANGIKASVLTYQSDLDELRCSGSCDRLDNKIRAALATMKS